jgi:hypothetical protein
MKSKCGFSKWSGDQGQFLTIIFKYVNLLCFFKIIP